MTSANTENLFDFPAGQNFVTPSNKIVTITGPAPFFTDSLDMRVAYTADLSDTDEPCLLIGYKTHPGVTVYENIKSRCEGDAPDKNFLWPIDVVEANGTIGYLVKQIPSSADAASQGDTPAPCGIFDLLTDVDWNTGTLKYTISPKARLDICIRIVTGLRKLHKNGLFYYVMDPHPFLIDPQKGDVFFTDCDLLAREGHVLFDHTYRPMHEAPELVKKSAVPSADTNMYAVALYVFELLFNLHPFDGQKGLTAALSPDKETALFATNPIFIFDPVRTENRPHPVIHRSTIVAWNAAPDFLKDFFTDMFSAEALADPAKRKTSDQFLDILLRYRSTFVRCSCARSFDSTKGDTCPFCRQKVDLGHSLVVTDKYIIPLLPGQTVYRRQLDPAGATGDLEPLISISAYAPGGKFKYALRNRSQTTITATTKSGAKKMLKPDETGPMDAICGLSIGEATTDEETGAIIESGPVFVIQHDETSV